MKLSTILTHSGVIQRLVWQEPNTFRAGKLTPVISWGKRNIVHDSESGNGRPERKGKAHRRVAYVQEQR